MNAGGDAAEQVVRMSLEGMEIAARITGSGAKNIAVLIAAVLKEEEKTSGKARLSNMIKSGKELKVFTVQQKDVKKFAQEAKRYGVLYSVLREKGNNDPNAVIDVIARAVDAPKISRIVERFNLNTVDKASVVRDIEAERNPEAAKVEKSPRSLQNLERKSNSLTGKERKPSVKKEINKYRAELKNRKGHDVKSSSVKRSNKKKAKER